MKQPKGFVDPNFPNHLCLLRKAIYGLKQALRAWYMRLSNFLYSLLVFFVLWAPRSSLFIQHSYSQTLYVLIYVYDIVITGSHAGAIRGLIASLLQLSLLLRYVSSFALFSWCISMAR